MKGRVVLFTFLFTLGFLCDEATKFWKVGRYYFGFWNGFNLTLYLQLGQKIVIGPTFGIDQLQLPMTF